MGLQLSTSRLQTLRDVRSILVNFENKFMGVREPDFRERQVER